MSAAVLGGFWPENGVSTLNTAHTTSSAKRRISQMFAEKGSRQYRRALRALTGVVAGSAALETQARVVAAEELGGKRVIETETLINRNTTAGDATDLIADLMTLTTKTYNGSPVANLDGNPLGTR